MDEAGNVCRRVYQIYGPEGELAINEGGTQFAEYSYDALYRLHNFTDGNEFFTSYYYNRQGYLDSVTYPGYTGPTPSLNAASGEWSNVTCFDSTRFASYDPDDLPVL